MNLISFWLCIFSCFHDICWKGYLSAIGLQLYHVSGSISVSLIFPPSDLYGSLSPITYMLDYLTIQGLKSCRMIPTILCFFKIVLAILISYILYVIIIFSMRNFAEILTQIMLNLFINLRRADTLSRWVFQLINTIKLLINTTLPSLIPFISVL